MKVSKASLGALSLAAALMVLAASPAARGDDPGYAFQRAVMVRVIADHSGWVSRAERVAPVTEAVLAAMGRVERHEFVPADVRALAYADRPLPIGYGQTISQPYIVALMTALVDAGPGTKALEVGTGSGYQAAVLAEMEAEVYTIEIIPPLAKAVAERLSRAGYGDVNARQGDGYFGWEEHAPFDAIVVTAAADHVPPPLIAQLRSGGRMVIPVGGPFWNQQLVLVTKNPDGTVKIEQLLPVRFVPLTGDR